jgi:thiosulfate reductase cytochrome b subunit
MYKIPLRIWHWFNAFLFFTLILSGLSLHYSSSGSVIIPFEMAVKLHKLAGITTSTLYLYFFIYNFISGNYKQYLPILKPKNLIIQIRFYLSGIFKNESHPFDSTLENKFNPLQKITYFSIMYLMVPVVIVSGLLLLYPENAQSIFWEIYNLKLIAIIHAAMGFCLSLFFVGHIYLATTGEKIVSNFKAMLTGWHESEI